MAVTLNGTNGLTFNDGSSQATAASGFGFKNRIINGNMVIDQRNAGASVTITTAGSYTYTIDRWAVYPTQASKLTVQRNAGSVTPPAGFSNYFGATVAAAANVTVGSTDLFLIRQAIEGFNITDLGWGAAGASSITLSFWVRSSLTGVFGGSLSSNSASLSYPFTYTISSANTWELKTVTIPGPTTGGTAAWPTDNGTGIRVFFSLGTGSSFLGTAGSWTANDYFSATGSTNLIATNSATWYITGVQLEKGSTATSFDYRPYSTELQLCQRYYYRLSIANQSMFSNGQCASTDICFGLVQFPVPMRTAPTALEQSGTASHYTVYHSGTNTNCSVVPTYTTATTADNALVNFTVASGLTVGRAANQRSNNNAAYLGWSAEL